MDPLSVDPPPAPQRQSTPLRWSLAGATGGGHLA